MRPTGGVGQRPALWLLFLLRLRRCLKLRYIPVLFFFFILFIYLRLLKSTPTNHDPKEKIPWSNANQPLPPVNEGESPRLGKCTFDETEVILRYKSPKDPPPATPTDVRPQPTVQRLHTLFKILIAHEEKYRKSLDYLQVFRFSDLYNTLRPYANQTRRLHDIYCLFSRYITVSDNGHIDVSPTFIGYLKQLSTYLSDGFTTEHPTWRDKTVLETLQKPVIILGSNSRFYDNLQASMRTVNEFFATHPVAIYDLGFDQSQLQMIRDNCARCMIIPFPFAELEPEAPHVRNLPNFAWKPIVVQDAVRRFGTIIYGDTSVRYMTSNFDRILIDNLQRGFSCRELPGHYLSCFTLSGTISWFNETFAAFDDVYIAEAGFVAVTDNFLSRLVLKTWVACALDPECISPTNSRTQCKRIGGMSGTHRFDQSAMVVVLSFYFFQSARQNEQTNPAPYDMFASIQQKVAEVRRFEGDHGYFTSRKDAAAPKTNSSSLLTTTTILAAKPA